MLLFSALMVVFTVVLKIVNPTQAAWLPEGINAPIIALEFLQSNIEVLQFFGESGSRQSQMINGFMLGNYIDYIYLILYTGLLCSFAFLVKSSSNKSVFKLIMMLSIIAGIADVFENIQISNIIENLDTGVFDVYLSWLNLFTWIKWGYLSLSLFFIFAFVFKQSWIKRIGIGISVITIVFGIIAFNNRSLMTTLFTLGITVQFAILIVSAIINGLRKNELSYLPMENQNTH